MKQSEFALLVAAGAIETVTIYRDATAGEGWTVWCYGDGVKTRNCLEAARGGKRTWANLDTAHRWIRQQGWKGAIQIDEAFVRAKSAFRITSRAGLEFGVYDGETEEDAFEAMIADGGDGVDAGGNRTAGSAADWIIERVKS